MGTPGQLLLVFCTTLPFACARNDPPGIRAAAPATTHGIQVSAIGPQPSAPVTPSDSGTLPHSSVSSLTQAQKERIPGSINDPAFTASSTAARPSVPPQPANLQPALVDAQGQALPQTEERPTTSGASFQRRVEQLCQAIIEGAPAQAHGAFFPLLAYSQVKAVADPGRDYRLRLLAHFDRDILDYHRRLARRPGPYRCGGITVPENLARWMKPGSEYNKLGYFRVLRAHLQLVDAAEKTTSFEVTSLISWRGEWYVVHLNGFE
jgi:hypothetical protein